VTKNSNGATPASAELVPAVAGDDLALIASRLVEQARADGIALTGDGGLLPALVARVLETGLAAELTEHLGYDRHDPEGYGSGNSRNGFFPKTVGTEVGPVQVRVPHGTRRLDGLADQVISLYAQGLRTGEIQNHLEEVFGTDISKDTISRITDAICRGQGPEGHLHGPHRPGCGGLVRRVRRQVGRPDPAVISSWEASWNEFVPFLEFPAELRAIVYTTNAIESLNARFRRAVRHGGHFPTEQAAMKVLYLVATKRRPNRQDLTGRINGWRPILNRHHRLHTTDRPQTGRGREQPWSAPGSPADDIAGQRQKGP
jgi:transposase-like protein